MHNGMKIELAAPIIHRNQLVGGVEYCLISQHHCLKTHHLRAGWAVSHAAAQHPRGVHYPAPAAARAVAHALERATCTVAGFSALAIYGMPYLVEGADTTLLAPVERNQAATASTPALIRPSGAVPPAWELWYHGSPIRVTPPAFALVQALQQVKTGLHAWQVAPVPGLKPVDVRAVQLVDCARRFLNLTCAEIRSAAKGLIDGRWLKRVLKQSSGSADSPKETELRLLVQGIAENYGLELKEQVMLHDGDRIITVFDLAIPELRIALMYDGRHHMDFKQREKDSIIGLTSTLMEWTVLRCYQATMHRCLEILEQLIVKRLSELGLLPKSWLPG